MKIIEVNLENVKCYKEAKFNFENGINFISGINGSGKTSIIESIGFAIFDYKASKTRFNRYFIRHGEKKASVKIIFEDKENKRYIIQRKISLSLNNSWIIKNIENEEEIVSGDMDVINWLKDHLGFQKDDNMSEMYENIISVPQGMFTSAFLDTDKSRKAKFDPIFKLEVYRKIFQNTASLESSLKAKKIDSEKELTKYLTKIEILAEDKKEYNSLKKEIKEKEKLQLEKNKQISQYNKEYEEKLATREKIDVINQKIKIDKINQEHIKEKIENLNEEIELSEKKINKSKEDLKILEEELSKNNIEEVENMEKEIQQQINEKMVTIKQLEANIKIVKNGICPYLQTECLNVKGKNEVEYKEKIDKINIELVKFNNKKIQTEKRKTQITYLKIDIANLKNKLELLSNENEKEKREIEKQNQNLKDIMKKIKEEEKENDRLKKDFNEEEYKNIENIRNKLLNEFTQITTILETKNQRKEILEAKVSELKKLLQNSKELEMKIEKYSKIIKYLNKMREIIKDAPEEISKILIQKVSRKATEIYSRIANDNTRLEWREGYEIILIDNVDDEIIEKEFKQLSGGEQMSAALAIRIAMLEIITNLKIGILDEPTVNMDSGRRERLAETIEDIGSLFVQIFVVSHDDTFNSITENIISTC